MLVSNQLCCWSSMNFRVEKAKPGRNLNPEKTHYLILFGIICMDNFMVTSDPQVVHELRQADFNELKSVVRNVWTLDLKSIRYPYTYFTSSYGKQNKTIKHIVTLLSPFWFQISRVLAYFIILSEDAWAPSARSSSWMATGKSSLGFASASAPQAGGGIPIDFFCWIPMDSEYWRMLPCSIR